MSLDVTLTEVRPIVVFDSNITHNLTEMAEAAGIYHLLWRPEELGITKASQMIGPLSTGLKALKERPTFLKSLNPENGWGSYENLVLFVEQYLDACMASPDADVSVSR